jgi:general secretion pathway protein D
LALITSACQTFDDAPTTNTWALAPLVRPDPGKARTAGANGTSLLADRPVGKTTVVEGTGRFVGDPHPPDSQLVTGSIEDGVTLNLVNVPAPQAAKTILGDMLGVKYTVDPGIEGKITIQTPEPVPKSAVINLFQAALKANGAAIVTANGFYKIVAADMAPVGAIIQTGNAPGPEGKLGSGLQVVQLKYVAASELKRILEPIAPRGGIVRADDARRILTLSGTSQEVAGMMEAISIFDVDVMKGMSFALVPVRISEPTVIADELRTVFASEQDGPMARMVQFLPNKRLGAILVISPQRGYLARAADWVHRLDAQAAGSEKQFFTYAVQNRRAQELVDVLQSMFSSETGGSSGSGGNSRNVAPQYQAATVQSSGFPQSSSPQFGPMGGGGGATGSIGTGSSTQNWGGAPQAQFQPATAAGAGTGTGNRETGAPIQVGRDAATGEPRIKLVADDAKNALLIEAAPADYRRVMRVIGTLDVMPNQVLLEATIAEISLTDDLKFGLRWFFQGKNANYTFTDAASGSISSVFPGFSYALATANIAVTLNALNQITEVNVVSSPSLMVMDNKTAFLQIGDQVPITTQSAISVLGIGAPIVNSVSYRDTGVILSMTPRINQSGRVLLDIQQEVSSVSPTTSSGIDSPTIRQRRVRTNVVVNDGEALVLGGMIQDNKTLARTQIPILGDLPLVGNAFKQKDNSIGKTELIIIVTPHVVRDLNEARKVTDEFRRELANDHHQWPNIGQAVRRTFE